MNKRILYPIAAFFVTAATHISYSLWKIYDVASKWVQLEGTSWISGYLQSYDYFLSLSYASTAAFTVYAVMLLRANKKSSSTGILGGLTLGGALYFGVCFMLGCCGSPMLAVYLGLFGSSFLGLAKPLVLIVTLISISIAIFILKRRTKCSCCSGNKSDD